MSLPETIREQSPSGVENTAFLARLHDADVKSPRLTAASRHCPEGPQTLTTRLLGVHCSPLDVHHVQEVNMM